MKIEVTDFKENEELKFPCLMISDAGTIIIASSKHENVLRGVSIKLGDVIVNAPPVGDFNSKWDATVFSKFTGTVTLSND